MSLGKSTQWERQERDENHKKEPVRNEEYNNWNENYIRRNQHRLDEAENQISDLEDKRKTHKENSKNFKKIFLMRIV